MTDPVDTDALRNMGAALGKDGHTFGPRIIAAAHEIDLLRLEAEWASAAAFAGKTTVQNLRDRITALQETIVRAPHDAGCDMRLNEKIRIPEDKCTCWKADAL